MMKCILTIEDLKTFEVEKALDHSNTLPDVPDTMLKVPEIPCPKSQIRFPNSQIRSPRCRKGDDNSKIVQTSALIEKGEYEE